jgi:hypothetical protein
MSGFSLDRNVRFHPPRVICRHMVFGFDFVFWFCSSYCGHSGRQGGSVQHRRERRRKRLEAAAGWFAGSSIDKLHVGSNSSVSIFTRRQNARRGTRPRRLRRCPLARNAHSIPIARRWNWQPTLAPHSSDRCNGLLFAAAFGLKVLKRR